MRLWIWNTHWSLKTLEIRQRLTSKLRWNHCITCGQWESTTMLLEQKSAEHVCCGVCNFPLVDEPPCIWDALNVHYKYVQEVVRPSLWFSNRATNISRNAVERVVCKERLSMNGRKRTMLHEQKSLIRINFVVHKPLGPVRAVFSPFPCPFLQRRHSICWIGIGSSLEMTRMLVVCKSLCQAFWKSTLFSCFTAGPVDGKRPTEEASTCIACSRGL